MSGYVNCGCRDCFEIAIASDDDAPGETLCNECEEAGCEAHHDGEDRGSECRAPGAYGQDDETNDPTNSEEI